MNALKRFLHGDGGGLKWSDIDVKREQFSALFPWVAYDKEEKCYFMRDNAVGFIWECSPVLFADDGMFNTISAILRDIFPHDTVFQFSLYADSFVTPITSAYRNIRRRNKRILPIHAKVIENYSKFWEKGAKEGLWHLSGTRMRNFRLFFSVRIPMKHDAIKNRNGWEKELKEHRSSISNISETLKKLHPEEMQPSELITLMYRICNPTLEEDHIIEWSENMPIHKQILYSDTVIERKKESIAFNNRHIGCITPKKLPREADNLLANDLIGYISKGASANENDSNQIKCPFIYTVNICINKNLKAKLEAKALHNSSVQKGQQKESGGHMETTMVAGNNRKQEHFYMAQRYEQGDKFLQVIPQIILIGDTEEELTSNINRVRSIWNSCGVEPQVERDYLLHVLFISAFPCGFYPTNLSALDRDWPIDTQGAAILAPVQASFSGLGKPVLLYSDRRGQLFFLDTFSTGNNKNFFVTGGTGAGKSFFMNSFINQYMSIGAKFRIITVCDSYKKACYISDGQYIEHDDTLCFNFFSNAGVEKAILQESVTYGNTTYPIGTHVELLDITDSYAKILIGTDTVVKVNPGSISNLCLEMDGDTLNMCTGILASMATSRSGDKLDEDELTIIETAIQTAFIENKRDTTIDHIHKYLMNISNYHQNDERATFYLNLGYRLANRLSKYCTGGQYGHLFNGKSNVSFNKDLVVVDLVKTPEDLRKVMVLAIASITEQEIYKGDRETPKFVTLDESWQTLSENPYAVRFVEGLYRKARKYNASVCIATQSLHDLHPEQGKLKYLGNVIRTQSAFSFSLFDEDFDFAFENKLLNISEFEFKMLVKKIPFKSAPKYSEIFARTPNGRNVIRLIVDEFMYFLNTSGPKDFVYLKTLSEQFIKAGFNKPEAMSMAIDEAVKQTHAMGGLGKMLQYIEENFHAEEVS
jgi:conjugal transfer ATP-binding protein TraC